MDKQQPQMSLNSLLSGVLAFVGWTVTSFLCHQSAKLFLRTATAQGLLENGAIWAAVITLAQMSMCYLLTDIPLSDINSSRAQKIIRVKILCHVLATMATNYSMTLVHASSTFAIKLLEPITSAVVQRIVLGTSMSPSAILSLPVIIGGAVTFCGGTITTSSSLLGIVMAFASNVILAFRNVAIKLEQSDSSMKSVKLRYNSVLFKVLSVCIGIVIFMQYLHYENLVGQVVSFLAITAVSTSVFHVAYSYISTNIVLLYMSVVSHSVSNIFKRVLVVLLLYAVGHRAANAANFIGLGICTLGLLIYVQGKISFNSTGSSEFKPSTGSRIFRVFAILVMLTFVGPLPYIPRAVVNMNEIREPDFIWATFGKNSLSSYRNTTNLIPNVNENLTEFRDEFMKRHLVKTPDKTWLLASKLDNNVDIVKEAQRVHFNVFSDVLAPHKYAILLDLAAFENKGDPCITTGEVYLVRRMGLKVLYYCTTGACTDKALNYSRELADMYPKKEVVVMVQGGGNLVGYAFHDYFRRKVFAAFPGYHVVLFPQSIFVGKGAEEHVKFCQDVYRNQSKFTMMIRDRLSFKFAMKNFKGPNNQIILMPDMAFQMGAMNRFISPMYDILWLRRSDEEVEEYEIPPVPLNVSLKQVDWFAEWPTPQGANSIETAFLIGNNGLICLQRGRVIVTDRLHGHILSVLLNIPHVLLDTSSGKLTSYHDTWTRRLPNTLVAKTVDEALKLGIELLHRYNDTLTPIAPFMRLYEYV